MGRKLLEAFSYFSHPIFAPVYGVLLFIHLDVNRFDPNQKWLILAQAAIVTVAIPMIFFFLLRVLGKADSLMLPEASQRRLPLFFQIVLFYILTERSFTEANIPPLHYFFTAAMGSACLALVFLAFRVRASLHMLGMAGLLGFAFCLGIHNQNNPSVTFAGLCVLCGLTASSRLSMKAHDWKELTIGFLTGLIPQLLTIQFWV